MLVRLSISVLVIVLMHMPPCESTTLTVERGSDLQSVIDFAADGDTIILAAKPFQAASAPLVESLCGNCEQHQTQVSATRGFIIKNKGLIIIGNDRSESRLITNAGYGVYFENSYGSELKNLTITGGRRDADGNATDAAVVARNSSVAVVDVDIINNDHRIDSLVIGVGGVMGREGSELIVRNCRIENNSWDGVALYRGAHATVTDCLIKDGRGAGIGVTWDASCVAYRNEIVGYHKGIGSFGTSWVIARNNLVRDNLGWGIIATGQSYMDITNNVVYHNGNCGVAPWSSEARGRIVNNIIARNGWKEEWVCPCVGIWNYGDWAKWEFSHNLVWDNRDGDYHDIWNQTGIMGNISEDPLFVGENDFRLRESSPALNAGDSAVSNHDGTVSHIGLYGGPQARRR